MKFKESHEILKCLFQTGKVRELNILLRHIMEYHRILAAPIYKMTELVIHKKSCHISYCVMFASPKEQNDSLFFNKTSEYEVAL